MILTPSPPRAGRYRPLPPPWRWRRSTQMVLGVSLLLALFEVALPWHALTPSGSRDELVLATYGLFLFVLVGLTLPPALVLALFARWRAGALRGSRLAALFLGGWVATVECGNGLLQLSGQDRLAQLAAMTERSAPVIQAIERYGQTHGTPPAGLSDLVPEFLPDLPHTGLGAYPDYRYDAAPEGGEWLLRVEVPSGIGSLAVMTYAPGESSTSDDMRIGDWIYEH